MLLFLIFQGIIKLISEIWKGKKQCGLTKRYLPVLDKLHEMLGKKHF
jgi:hypothetical protein